MKPIAPQKPHRFQIHNHQIEDPYAWLKDRNDPDTIPYLESENAYCERELEHTKELRQKLYDEMLGRIQEDDQSVPYQVGDWLRYSRTEAGKAYTIFCRQLANSPDAKEEIYLDENDLAEGLEYFHLDSIACSPNQEYVAWLQDIDGSEHFELHIQEIQSKKKDPIISHLKWSIAWADDEHIVYVKGDDAQRPYQIWMHRLGTDPAADSLLWEELDERFFLSVERSRNGQFVILSAESKTTSEIRLLECDLLHSIPTPVFERKDGVKYDVAVGKYSLYIRSNENAMNFKLLEFQRGGLSEVIPHNPEIYLVDVDAFEDYLLLWMRENGLPIVEVLDLATKSRKRLSFPDPTYDLYGDRNPHFQAQQYRLRYASPVTPDTVFSINFATLEMTVLKQQVVHNFNPKDYICMREWARTGDGTLIPISIAKRRDAPKTTSFLLYGYGSYGYSYPAGFRSSWIGLMDRGMSIGIAHIRGGGDLGRNWYENGKLFHKKNSFTDFIACVDHLNHIGLTTYAQLTITGGSAGGLLMGAVINMRPDIAKACVAQVPFVDVVNTMLDPNLPLTVIEYEEWGNPNEAKPFEYILSYSPYDNIQAHNYPNLYITGGLNDPRVGYWEPAKWVAKIRNICPEQSVLMRMNMGAGHGGASGRYGYLEDIAHMYAFILDQVAI